MGSNTTQPGRIASLDQFRGYTVLGMFLVNFVGSFVVTPVLLKHRHDYCSYADTIMPQFLFAVGFAYRMTFLKRWETLGLGPAAWRTVKRSLGLVLLGAVVYHLDGRVGTWAELQALGLRGFLSQAFQRSLFQTLVHIGVTTLWVLPVIGARGWVRFVYMVLSAGLFVWLSHEFYYDWVMKRPGIDGGPLGFLTWTIPLLVGSLAYDAVISHPKRLPVGRLLAWGVILMGLGYDLSCLNTITPPNSGTLSDPRTLVVEPPFFPPSQPNQTVNLWTMSQRAGSVSYLVFGAGFSVAVYALFMIVCDWIPARKPELAPRSALPTLVAKAAWLPVLLGGLGFALGVAAHIALLWEDAKAPGTIQTILRALDPSTGITATGWTWITLGCGLVALAGWEVRRLALRSGTLLGSVFTTFGTNALAGYVLHSMVSGMIKPYAPKDAPLWYALLMLALFLGVCYLFLRYLEKHRLFLRL